MSWSTETTVSSTIENRKTRTAAVGPAKSKGRGTAPSLADKTQISSESSTKSLGTQPKKPTDDAWKNVAITPLGVPYPDPRGMKSRPYDPDEGRPHPALKGNVVEYRSEIGNGSYPLSC
eukprot:4441015-Amphidinium_carterae.1